MNDKDCLEIAERLHQIETITIGVFGNLETCMAIANKLIEEKKRILD